MTIYGYARVSRDGQTLAVQKDLLAKAGIQRLYAEKVSSIVAKRPQLERLLDRLDEGDVLIIRHDDGRAHSEGRL